MISAKQIAQEDTLIGQLPNLSTDERNGLRILITWLQQRYGEDLMRVLVFGSKVRGDADAESDLDVLVVLRAGDDWQRWQEITDFTTQLLLQTGVNVSALVCDEVRYRWWATHRAPIYNSIQREGVELWRRPGERLLRSA